jgi:hypothetical protein
VTAASGIVGPTIIVDGHQNTVFVCGTRSTAVIRTAIEVLASRNSLLSKAVCVPGQTVVHGETSQTTLFVDPQAHLAQNVSRSESKYVCVCGGGVCVWRDKIAADLNFMIVFLSIGNIHRRRGVCHRKPSLGCLWSFTTLRWGNHNQGTLYSLSWRLAGAPGLWKAIHGTTFSTTCYNHPAPI